MNTAKFGESIKIIKWDMFGRPTIVTPTIPGGAGANLRRTSWRELVN